MLHTLLLLGSLTLVLGHGRVTQPPSRASAWRLGFPTPANYDDDGLNCGGFSTQWSSNGGKCGICGDAYSTPPPRPHELGGTYGVGVIVAKYLPGSTIATTTHLTTSHMGYWEFKLCPDPTDNSQACFDKHLLVTEDGETKYTPARGSGIYEVNYKLPPGLICEHCVLQWRYVAGNNWGICSNGTSGLGCGNQEEFRACSDIAIGVSKTMGDVGNIPSQLLFYLQKGYFELDQGYLIHKDPKRPTAPQRPTRPKPSNRQPKTTNQQPQHSNQQPSNRLQPSQQHTFNQQSQLLNRQPQTFNQHIQLSNQHHSNTQSQHLKHPNSNHQTQTSNPQYASNRQPQPSKQHTQQSQLNQSSKQQRHPSNPQPQTSIRQHHKQEPQQLHLYTQPSKQQYYPSKEQLQHLNQQHHTKAHSSKAQQSSKRKPKSAKHKLKSVKHQPNPLRYDYKTSDKRKTKAKSKKKKKARGHPHGKQKTRSQRHEYP